MDAISREAERLAFEVRERRKHGERSGQRILLAAAGLGALCLAAYAWSMRIVPANDLTNVPAHTNGLFTLGALVFVSGGMIMLAGAAGLLDSSSPTFEQSRRRRSF